MEFEVFAESSRPTEPCESAFYDPALGPYLEGVQLIPFDYLHFALREAPLIYRSTETQNGSFGNTFITHHEVKADSGGKQSTLEPVIKLAK